LYCVCLDIDGDKMGDCEQVRLQRKGSKEERKSAKVYLVSRRLALAHTGGTTQTSTLPSVPSETRPVGLSIEPQL
jgi:hypothetical protein